MKGKRTKTRLDSVVLVFQVSTDGAFWVDSIDSEERRFCWILNVVALPDLPQRFGHFRNVHHGSLFRKLLMDTVHVHLVVAAALFSEAYV